MTASVESEPDESGMPSRSEQFDAENTTTPALQPGDGSAQVTPGGAADDSGEVERGLVLRARYVLEEVIGRGGSSIVFRARDLHRASTEDGTSQYVAVKLLRAQWRTDPRAIERLRREFRQMQSLSHSGIVRVFDLDCDGGVWFMTMELVEGRTAKSFMQEPYEQADALRVITTCCHALEHAHAFGFLHGDLKPTNVLVADDGTVKLIDFGAAPSPGSRVAAQASAMLATTALYASPQVLAGKPAEVSDDVFSLACLSYGVLSAGKHPFGRRPSLEDGRAKSAPTRVSAIPPAMFTVIERGLSADRHQRPESVTAFLAELTQAAAHLQPEILTAVPEPALAATVTPEAPQRRGVTAAGLPAAAAINASRGGRHGAWPFVNLAFLVLAVIATAVMIQSDRHESGKRAVTADAATADAAATASGSAGSESATQQQGASSSVPTSGSPDVLAAANTQSPGSGIISFEESTLQASAMQPLVAVSVKRMRGSNGPAAFVWRVEGGTAYPGVDYQPIQPQLVRFLAGQTVRTLFIPLINTRAAQPTQRPRSFTVALQPVAGGPSLGRIDRLTVTIEPAAGSVHQALYQARADQ
ncbi:MAG: protein kinase [Steroidobacteraceae bacterium]